MKEFWNERYGQEAYAHGTDPKAFFKSRINQLSQGLAQVVPIHALKP